MFAIGMVMVCIASSCMPAGGGAAPHGVSSTRVRAEEKVEKEIVIGVTVASFDSPYLGVLCRYMEQTAEEMGVKLLLEDAHWNVEKQIVQLEEFMRQGVDAIILCPVNSKSMLVVLKQIRGLDIPLINLNMRVDAVSAEYIDTYVGASSAEEAVLAAQLFIEQMGEKGGRIAIIEGAVGSEPQIFRTQVFIEELKPYPQIEIVSIGDGGWNRNKAMLTTLDILNRFPDIEGYYCHDSNMALGIVQALEDSGITEKKMIVGISEDEEYLQAIEEGALFGLITQPPEFEGPVAVECAVKAARGEVLRPWYKDPIQIITAENVGTYTGMGLPAERVAP